MADEMDSRRDAGGRFDGFQDIFKKTISLGGLISREDAKNLIREVLPKNVTEYVAQEIGNLRQELGKTMKQEIALLLSRMDMEAIINSLEGRTLEINAKVTIGPKSNKTKQPDAPPAKSKDRKTRAKSQN